MFGEIMAKYSPSLMKTINPQIQEAKWTPRRRSMNKMTPRHNSKLALAGVAQWTECQHENQRVTGLIPSQGTCLGCRQGPQ